MEDVLKELNIGNQVLIETDNLPKFLEYCKVQKYLYSFRLEYYENMVKITLTGKESVIKY